MTSAKSVDPGLMDGLRAAIEACAEEGVGSTGEGCIFQVGRAVFSDFSWFEV